MSWSDVKDTAKDKSLQEVVVDLHDLCSNWGPTYPSCPWDLKVRIHKIYKHVIWDWEHLELEHVEIIF
jgi:hypothetical protein